MDDIEIQPTPNPNALKFILGLPVKTEGKTSYKDPSEATSSPLAMALFDLRGVDQVHFFQNVITISKFSFEPWDALESKIISVITENIESHDPNFEDINPEKERRQFLSPELQKIEEIMDQKIRPGLQGDGGDLQVLELKDNILLVKYQGACGTCPSSTTGTLEAIRGILRDEFNPDIEVYIAPEI